MAFTTMSRGVCLFLLGGAAMLVWLGGPVYAGSEERVGAAQNGIPIQVGTSDDRNLVAVPDGTGGGFLASGTTTVILQRLSSSGQPIWPNGGVVLSTAGGVPAVCPDGAGGVIVAWSDWRNVPGQKDVYAQRIAPDAKTLWTASGVSVCTAAGSQHEVRLIEDGDGGAVIVWLDGRNSKDGTASQVFAAHLDSKGNHQSPPGGIPVSSLVNQKSDLRACSDGAGGMIVGWRELRGKTADLYFQRFGRNGVPMLGAFGKPLCVRADEQQSFTMAADGKGGFLAAWANQGSAAAKSLSVQRVGADDMLLWEDAGVTVSACFGDTLPAQLLPDGTGGGYVVWTESEGGANFIAAQKLRPDGFSAWDSRPLAVSGRACSALFPRAIVDRGGGVLVFYTTSAPCLPDLAVSRIRSDGVPDWAGQSYTVSTGAGWQRLPVLVADWETGVLLAWEDERNSATSGNWDIYGTRMVLSGGGVQPEEWTHFR